MIIGLNSFDIFPEKSFKKFLKKKKTFSFKKEKKVIF